MEWGADQAAAGERGSPRGAAHLDRLVKVAHILRLHVRVLLAGAHQLGERGQQALDADAAHIHELPGDQRCTWAREGGCAAERPADLRPSANSRPCARAGPACLCRSW